MDRIMPADYDSLWRDIAPVGRSASSGGYNRAAFTSAERELDAWFVEQSAARGLEVERDRFGNTVAWWRPAGSFRSGGPHRLPPRLRLDGGAYDGPLGVVSSLAAVDLLRDRGFTPSRPIGIGVFVEEEGSRFGLACLGSRLATGAMSWDDARILRDRDGVALEDAFADVEHGDADLLRQRGLLRRAARRAGPRPRRPGRPGRVRRARSGRTGATASTSRVRPTTPARPGWRTGTTRC